MGRVIFLLNFCVTWNQTTSWALKDCNLWVPWDTPTEYGVWFHTRHLDVCWTNKDIAAVVACGSFTSQWFADRDSGSWPRAHAWGWPQLQWLAGWWLCSKALTQSDHCWGSSHENSPCVRREKCSLELLWTTWCEAQGCCWSITSPWARNSISGLWLPTNPYLYQGLPRQFSLPMMLLRIQLLKVQMKCNTHENGYQEKIKENNKCSWGCGNIGTLVHCWWECKMVQSVPLWYSLAFLL